MRESIYKNLTRPVFVICLILATGILTFIDGNTGYFFGLVIALIALWASKFRWIEFGLGKPKWIKTIVSALIYSVLIFILIDFFIQPFIEIYVGKIDLSTFDWLRGNLTNYIIFILIMWVLAAFGEEFLYRGFFMKRLAIILGNTNKAWLLSAFILSALFGLAHYYQGLSGILTTGLVGFLLSMIFYKNKENLMVAILTHGFYDMIGLTLIYFSKERIIIEWIERNVL